MRRIRRSYILALPVAALALGLAWLWPAADSARAIAVWVPGESNLRGTMMRVMAADENLRLLAIHRPNVVVLQSEAPTFVFRLLAIGAMPFSVGASDFICRD